MTEDDDALSHDLTSRLDQLSANVGTMADTPADTGGMTGAIR